MTARNPVVRIAFGLLFGVVERRNGDTRYYRLSHSSRERLKRIWEKHEFSECFKDGVIYSLGLGSEAYVIGRRYRNVNRT